MNLLFDENIHRLVSKYFSQKSYNCTSIFEICRGCKDIDVANLSLKLEAVLITHDKDFGEMIFYQDIKCYGVILLRTSSILPADTIKSLENVLNRISDFKGKFVVVNDKSIRIRKLHHEEM
jgi:predicted nuclease of predicted toxin-antitoxin system